MFNLQIPENLKNSVSDDSFKVFVNDGNTEDEPAELLILDEIGEGWYGDGVSAKDVVGFVKENRGRDFNVRINSPGGLVYDGLTIYNALANHNGQVTVTIEGLAFSAASFIAMAGDKIRMHEASDIGIHRSMGMAMGNAKTARGLAEWLDTIDEHLVEIYQARTNQSRNQIEEWLDGTDDGTLFSAKDAVKHGFADELIPAKTKNQNRASAAVNTARKRIAAEHSARLRAMAR